MHFNDTAHKILDLAESFTQTRGFNAFSYHAIQRELGIKTSSIHYYFPTKQDLAEQMVKRYIDSFNLQLLEINYKKNLSAREKLESLAQFFIVAVKDGKFCLCGMLAADILAMPKTVEDHLCRFFTTNELWITEHIVAGIQNNEFKNLIQPEYAAAHLLATLEGGMLIARTRKQPEYLQKVMKYALDELSI
jgi:TetR/AcrR family transcriptional regulator, transcriptional repressor for nem operon